AVGPVLPVLPGVDVPPMTAVERKAAGLVTAMFEVTAGVEPVPPDGPDEDAGLARAVEVASPVAPRFEADAATAAPPEAPDSAPRVSFWVAPPPAPPVAAPVATAAPPVAVAAVIGPRAMLAAVPPSPAMGRAEPPPPP